MGGKKEGKKHIRFRLSLKREMALVYIILLGITLVACWIINDRFLEQSYFRYKEDNLIEVYRSIREAFESEKIGEEEFEEEIMRLSNKYNVSVVITDSSSNTIYSNIKDPGQISRQLRDIVFSRDQMNREPVVETGEYAISFAMDPFNKSEYLIIWGTLNETSFFMIRTPMESVREAVHLANRMLLIIGLVALLLAGVVIWFVTKKVTDPIMSLVDVSQHMAEMDFESRYCGKSHNEIGVLGENMNRLSSKLEENICRLKSANLELQKDVEARRSADERRAEFLANVSHELKTPIALIQGYAEGLKEGVIEDQESRDYYCDVIMDETRKMNRLVKMLISLNQVESGQDIMRMERFDMDELIRNCIESFTLLCEQKGISVFYESRPGRFVWADEYQVEEVLRNYLSNALNHCGGKMEIAIRLEEQGERLRIGVFNSGEPIPEESLPRLWEKFYKVDKARTREYGGSGLGLSIVKAIMDSLHQEYGVRNFEDGVEFWFTLETK